MPTVISFKIRDYSVSGGHTLSLLPKFNWNMQNKENCQNKLQINKENCRTKYTELYLDHIYNLITESSNLQLNYNMKSRDRARKNQKWYVNDCKKNCVH